MFRFYWVFLIEGSLCERIYSQFAVCWTFNIMSLPKSNSLGDFIVVLK
jgi:hypothetical protein